MRTWPCTFHAGNMTRQLGFTSDSITDEPMSAGHAVAMHDVLRLLHHCFLTSTNGYDAHWAAQYNTQLLIESEHSNIESEHSNIESFN